MRGAGRLLRRRHGAARTPHPLHGNLREKSSPAGRRRDRGFDSQAIRAIIDLESACRRLDGPRRALVRRCTLGFFPQRDGDGETGVRDGRDGAGRQLPGGTAAFQGVRGPRHPAAFQQLQYGADLAPVLRSARRGNAAVLILRRLGRRHGADAPAAEDRAHEVYHLAAQSHVRVSFDLPIYTVQTDALGTLHILEAVRASGQRRSLLPGVQQRDVRKGGARRPRTK